MSSAHKAHARRRESPVKSITHATMFSKTASTVVSAAKPMNAKKREPQSRPSGIELKTLGSVTNTSPGPCAGSMPNAKHAGITMSPDMIATEVSSAATLSASPKSRCRRPM